MSGADRGLMLVLDASTLYEVVADTPHKAIVLQRLEADPDHAAPHVIDVEVMNIVRDHLLRGLLDRTAANQAIEDLHDWPGERFGHRVLLSRAWQLRDNVRGWDAFYVALAEALGATLITSDARLGRATGPECNIEVVPRR